MLTLTKIIVSTLASLLLFSCQIEQGSANVITQTREVTESFDKISVSDGIDVILTQSQTASIQVEADDNLINHIRTNIAGGTLYIEVKKQGLMDFTEKNVRVTLPSLTKISASAGSDVKSTNEFRAEVLDLSASAGSEIEVSTSADRITAVCSSGSEIALTGMALYFEGQASSGSKIKASRLLCNEVTASASSGSDIDVHPIKELRATASSGASVDYYKNPERISQNSSSGGSIRQK